MKQYESLSLTHTHACTYKVQHAHTYAWACTPACCRGLGVNLVSQVLRKVETSHNYLNL